MSFKYNLNNTYELLKKLDNVIMKNADNNLLKKYLLLVSEDLVRYKEVDEKNINLNGIIYKY